MTKLVAGIRPYFHVVLISFFYIVSGSWQSLLGTSGEEGVYFGYSILSNIYSNYAIIIGLITIITGILLFCRVNFARILAIILAWWNLFTGPAIWIFWHIYAEKIPTDSFSEWFIYTVVLISIMTLIRIYIIRILSISRAGCIFIKHPTSPTS